MAGNGIFPVVCTSDRQILEYLNSHWDPIHVVASTLHVGTDRINEVIDLYCEFTKNGYIKIDRVNYVSSQLVERRYGLGATRFRRSVAELRKAGKTIRGIRVRTRRYKFTGEEFYHEVDILRNFVSIRRKHALLLKRIKARREKLSGLNEEQDIVLDQLVGYYLRFKRWPSHEELAKLVHLPRTSVSMWLMQLERTEVISRSYVGGKGRCAYRIHRASDNFLAKLKATEPILVEPYRYREPEWNLLDTLSRLRELDGDWPTRVRLSEVLGVSISAIDRSLSDLVKGGFLKKEKVWRQNIYTVLHQPELQSRE
jgi:predicted transcriptional regulator